MNLPAIYENKAPTPQNGLNDLLAHFAASLDARQTTLRTYLTGIRSFLVYVHRKGRTPDRAAVIAFREDSLRKRAPATVQTYLSGIRRFFSWLAEHGYPQPNPAADIKSPHLPKGFRRDCLTETQARELLESIGAQTRADRRDYALCALMLTCGLRDIEAARARISDLDRISDQAALRVWGKGRDSADEAVKLPLDVEEALKDYLQTRGKLRPDAPLFASESPRNTGKPLTTRSISRIIKSRLRAIGLDSSRITAHSLRHTCATLARLSGASREEVAACLRHASTATTALYDHALTWQNRRVESRVADTLFHTRDGL